MAVGLESPPRAFSASPESWVFFKVRAINSLPPFYALLLLPPETQGKGSLVQMNRDEPGAGDGVG